MYDITRKMIFTGYRHVAILRETNDRFVVTKSACDQYAGDVAFKTYREAAEYAEWWTS